MLQDFTTRRKLSCKRCKFSSNTWKACKVCKCGKKSCKTCKSYKNSCKTCKSYLQEIKWFLARSCNKADTFIARLARLSNFLQEIESFTCKVSNLACNILARILSLRARWFYLGCGCRIVSKNFFRKASLAESFSKRLKTVSSSIESGNEVSRAGEQGKKAPKG